MYRCAVVGTFLVTVLMTLLSREYVTDFPGIHSLMWRDLAPTSDGDHIAWKFLRMRLRMVDIFPPRSMPSQVTTQTNLQQTPHAGASR